MAAHFYFFNVLKTKLLSTKELNWTTYMIISHSPVGDCVPAVCVTPVDSYWWKPDAPLLWNTKLKPPAAPSLLGIYID